MFWATLLRLAHLRVYLELPGVLGLMGLERRFCPATLLIVGGDDLRRLLRILDSSARVLVAGEASAVAYQAFVGVVTDCDGFELGPAVIGILRGVAASVPVVIIFLRSVGHYCFV